MAFWKKKSHPTLSGTKELSQIFPPYSKITIIHLLNKMLALALQEKAKSIPSGLLCPCFSERDFFSWHPFKCDPHPPWVILPFLTTCSICLCFVLLLPCWVLLLCLFFFEAMCLGAPASLPHRTYSYSRSLAPPSKCWDIRCSEIHLFLHQLWLLPATHIKQLSNKM